MPAKTLAASLPKRAWRLIIWREDSNTTLEGRFAAVRVRPAHRDYNRPTPRPEEWLLVEWPKGEPGPTKFWLSTLPPTITRRTMVDQAKLRWRIEGGAAFTTKRRSASRPTVPHRRTGRFPP